MNMLISFILAIIPVIYLLFYFYKKDSQKPEPIGLVIKVFFYGVLGVFVALFFEVLLSLFKPLFTFSVIVFFSFNAFIIAGLVEESVKLYIVKKSIYKHEKFDEVMDGIVYTIASSLGFACFENIIYVMGSDIFVAILRGLTAVPMHAIMSGIMGYYIGIAKFAENAVEEKKLIRKGLMIAVLLHGAYDFPLMLLRVYPSLLWVIIAFEILLIYYSNKHLNKLIKSAKLSDLLNFRS